MSPFLPVIGSWFDMSLPKLPIIELVPVIRHSEHPLGRYLKGTRKIQLSQQELALRSEDIRKFAVYHELGHWWRTSRVPDFVITHPSDEEDFANGFAHFFLHPNQLSQHTFAVMESTLPDNCTSTIRGFAESVCERLESALLVTMSSKPPRK